MEHWEFLIQKQGDRSWLPLESPDVEILEGRYRVVVRSSRPDTDVEVRVVHQVNSEVPPKRKVQQRSRRTNSEGLIVVIPYTYLKPGIWELHCNSLMSDLSQNWQYAVHLQVSPQEALLKCLDPDETLGVTETLTPSPVFTSPDAAATTVPADPAGVIPLNPPAIKPFSLPPSVSTSPQKAEQILQSLLESIMPAVEMSVEDGEDGEAGVMSLEITSTSANLIAPEGNVTALTISLTETTYVASHGQSLIISGQVEATTQTADSVASQESIAAGELRVCLCNPERGQIISEIRQPLVNGNVLPSPFSCTVEIPANCQTQLILGQVSLYGNRHEDLASAPDQETVLATQQFTITAGLEELLEVITSDQAKADTQQPQPPVPSARKRPETASIPLNLALLDLVKTPQARQPVRFAPAVSQPLPPLIDPPKPAKSRPEPALPKFTHQSAEVVPVLEVADAATPDAVPTSPDAQAVDAATTLPTQLAEVEVGHDAVEVPPTLLSAVDAAFEELKLQYRFWTRLNALAADAEFSSPKMESFAGDDAVPDSTLVEEAAEEQFLGLDTDSLAQEIVVDDEVESKTATGDRTQPDQGVPRLFSLPKTSNDVVMPVPKLEVQKGELVAGQAILVRVQVSPLHGVQLAVKLWVQDCQTRLLLDGPRWIDDLVPDGLGSLESTLDLTVPLGSLEIRFEAIAVDSVTQQESHKVSIDRTVIPPDLPSVQPLEDALSWTP